MKFPFTYSASQSACSAFGLRIEPQSTLVGVGAKIDTIRISNRSSHSLFCVGLIFRLFDHWQFPETRLIKCSRLILLLKSRITVQRASCVRRSDCEFSTSVGRFPWTDCDLLMPAISDDSWPIVSVTKSFILSRSCADCSRHWQLWEHDSYCAYALPKNDSLAWPVSPVDPADYLTLDYQRQFTSADQLHLQQQIIQPPSPPRQLVVPPTISCQSDEWSLVSAYGQQYPPTTISGSYHAQSWGILQSLVTADPSPRSQHASVPTDTFASATSMAPCAASIPAFPSYEPPISRRRCLRSKAIIPRLRPRPLLTLIYSVDLGPTPVLPTPFVHLEFHNTFSSDF